MSSEELSAYELERLDNIRRNEAKLEALGLDSHKATNTSRRHKPSAPAPKRALEPPVEGWRRSTRHRTAPDVYSDETPLPDGRRGRMMGSAEPYEGPDEAPSGPEDDEQDEDDEAQDGEKQGTSARAKDARPPPAPGSSRAIKLDVDTLVAKHLGARIGHYKADAINVLTAGRRASFSKYVGSLEWRNAVVLWVNVGGADYKNVFSASGDESKGLTTTWYASPRYTEDTPVVQRLLSGREPVLLCCRLPGESYIFCGRCGYISHVPRRQPLKFVWQLLDEPQLRGNNDFKALLKG